MEFTSKLEELKKALELNFEPTPGFGDYKRFFPKEAVAHPAKINQLFLEYLITHYTKEGDTVLDPMAGTGSTLVMAALHGRNGVGVELEEKFVGWANQAKDLVMKHSMVGEKGSIRVIQGDARNLVDAINGRIVDAAITSVPYGGTQSGGGIAVKGYDGPNHSPADLIGKRSYMPDKFSSTGNISNIREHGNVDAVVSSPPFSNTLRKRGRSAYDLDRLRKAGYSEAWIRGHHNAPNQNSALAPQGYSQDPHNIGNLSPGEIDEVVTSPPYEQSEAFVASDFMKKVSPDIEARTLKYKTGAHKSQHHSASIEAERAYMDRAEKGRIENPDSIGKLKGGDIDEIISSPPYEEGIGHGGGRDHHQKLIEEKKLYLEGSLSYGKSSGNVGALKKETYLSAMVRCYEQMYAVLKPRGRCVIVIKPFQRAGKVVDLPWQTWLLLQKVGFQFEDVIKLRLKNMSFWRILMYKKNPNLEQIKHEYAIVVRKLG